MKDTQRSSSVTRAPRGTGSYTPVACNFCRLRKTKCNGVQPQCSTCARTGHECTWGAETAKRPSTKQYVESLKKRAEALEQYASLLESKLEQCRREHGGLSEQDTAYLQMRPSASMFLAEENLDFQLEEANPESESDGDNILCVPMGNLVLEDRSLLFHGPTSIFRHSQKVPNTSRFPEIIENPHECYVLMVEGADESHYNPDFDWSRYLPQVVPLDRREHDKLLDLLFKFFTSWCLRIVPALFLRDMWRALKVPRSQTPPKTTHYSPMLHNALLALATAFSDDPRIRDLKSRQYFARAAKEYIEPECQMPNICVVHALSILASFHSSQGDQTLGYTYFGMSARISQALGLGVDCSTWVKADLITHDDMLDRNWAYWTTFSQDVCWSLYVGRDFCVPSPSSKQNIPVPFVEDEFDELSWHYPKSNIPPQQGYLSRTFAASCQLLLIAREIMDIVNDLSGTGRRVVSYELISRIDVQLNTWKESLSPEVDLTISSRQTATPHRLMLHLAYWWLFILLHRPFYRRSRPVHSSAPGIDHVKLCNRAADNIMELLRIWHNLYGLRYVPITLIQVVFSAGTVYLLSAVQATSGLRMAPVSLKQSLDQAECSIKYLLECGRSWQCANNIAEILRSLIRQQLEPRLQSRGISPEPSNPDASPVRRRSGRRQKRLEGRRKSHMHSPSTPDISPIAIHRDVSPKSPPLKDVNYIDASSSTTLTSPYNQTFEFPYPAPVGAWNTQGPDVLPPDQNAALLGMSMEASGFLGMPGGEMLPEGPFVPFGVLDTSGYDGSQYPQMSPDSGQQMPLDLTEADLEAVQQFFRQ